MAGAHRTSPRNAEEAWAQGASDGVSRSCAPERHARVRWRLAYALSPERPTPRSWCVSRLPAVTVVIPTHNRPELMQRALESVLDAGLRRRRRGDRRLRCLRALRPAGRACRRAQGCARSSTSAARGLAGARNTGIDAGGPSTTSPSSTTTTTGSRASSRRRCSASRSDPARSWSARPWWSTTGSARTSGWCRWSTCSHDDLLRDRMAGLHSSTFVFDKDALTGPIGMVDEDLPGSYGEDYDLLLRTALGGTGRGGQPPARVGDLDGTVLLLRQVGRLRRRAAVPARALIPASSRTARRTAGSRRRSPSPERRAVSGARPGVDRPRRYATTRRRSRPGSRWASRCGCCRRPGSSASCSAWARGSEGPLAHTFVRRRAASPAARRMCSMLSSAGSTTMPRPRSRIISANSTWWSSIISRWACRRGSRTGTAPCSRADQGGAHAGVRDHDVGVAERAVQVRGRDPLLQRAARLGRRWSHRSASRSRCRAAAPRLGRRHAGTARAPCPGRRRQCGSPSPRPGTAARLGRSRRHRRRWAPAPSGRHPTPFPVRRAWPG